MSVNYTPSLGSTSNTGTFRFWCQKVLPLVYDDSLSYYELLCKVVDYLNKANDDIQVLAVNDEKMLSAFNQLQNYVNNYFDNLNVQNEINNKLDDYAADGTLQGILSQLVGEYSYPSIVDSVSDMTDIRRVYVLDRTGEIYAWDSLNFSPTGQIYGNVPYNLRTIPMSASIAEGAPYNKKASLLPSQTMAWVDPTWFDDMEGVNNVGWIFTFGRSSGSITSGYGTQLYIALSSKNTYFRRFTGNGWTAWDALIPANVVLYKGVLSGVDFNELVSHGKYYVPATNENVNAPTANSGGILDVTVAGSVVVQVFNDIIQARTFTRFRVSGEWKEWKDTIPNNLLTYNGAPKGDGVDFNNLIESGEYYLSFPNTAVNGPEANAGGILWVTVSGSAVVQIFNDINHHKTYTRFSVDGSWRDWFVSMPDDIMFYKGSIDSTSDFNDIVEPGFYYCSTPNEYVNAPKSNSAGVITVIKAGSVIVQILDDIINNAKYSRYHVSGTWQEWKDVNANNIMRIAIGADSAESKYNKIASNILPNTFAWVDSSWFTDMPSAGTGWLTSIGVEKDGVVSYKTQTFFNPSNNNIYTRRYTSGGYTEWVKILGDKTINNKGSIGNATDYNTIIDTGLYYAGKPNTNANAPIANCAGILLVSVQGSVVTQTFFDIYTGIIYTRFALNGEWRKWMPTNGRNNIAKYYAFGDSTTYGQNAVTGGQSPYNYPNCVGKALGLAVTNKGTGGQGLIKDWDFIHTNYIDGLDMGDASLITVGWAYNDGSYYSAFNFGTFEDTTEDTVIGKYYTIMREFQIKCPNALVVLITGYGSTTVGSQFTKVINFADVSKTYGEFYDELEKMCNLHGWNCINQHKGTWVTEFNWSTMIGDNIHPFQETYLNYGNFIAGKISSIYQNLNPWAD